MHPTLIQAILRVQVAMAALGHPMKAYQGLRTAAQQAELYKQGRTLPGRIVTDCDGIVTLSNHQAKADGFGHAVDCCSAVGEAFPEGFPWQAYGHAVEAVGLHWGGHFPIIDLDHAELP